MSAAIAIIITYAIAWAIIALISFMSGFMFSLALWVNSERHRFSQVTTAFGLAASIIAGILCELAGMVFAQAEGGYIAIAISLAICIASAVTLHARRKASPVRPRRAVRATG
jgi:hypothetical protein